MVEDKNKLSLRSNTPDPNGLGRIAADLSTVLRRNVAVVEPIAEGHSGFSYWVHFTGGGRAVLRLPPPGARPVGVADVVRQGRIMSAVRRFGVPAPKVIASSTDPRVDARPYLLVEVMPGLRVEEATETVDSTNLATSAVRTLRRLHSIPAVESGIESEAAEPPAAELARWTRLFERVPPDLAAPYRAIAARLELTAPPLDAPRLVHSDFHYGNLLFEAAEVSAVLDWELARIGDPAADLATLCLVARGATYGSLVPGGTVPTLSEAQILAAYSLEPEDIQWQLALAYFKYAAIFAYNLSLHRSGKRPASIYEQRAHMIAEYLTEAEGLAALIR